jgi:hypothetical protein
MGTIKQFFFLCFCMCVLQTHANDSALQYKLYKTIPGNFTNFSVDNLGNIYLVSANNQIKKINQQLDSVGVFNDVKRYGKVSLIDATNPLKILIYYKDFATIIVLDRFLNTRNTIDLRSQNILQVQTIALSYDNNIWLFDELDARIKKIDETGKVLLASTDFRMLYNEVPNPTNLIDANGLLYLYNSTTGWLLFDYYGAQKSNYAMLHWQDVQVIQSNLMGRTNDVIHVSQPKVLSIENYTTNIPLKGAIKVYHQAAMMYVLNETGLSIYQR